MSQSIPLVDLKAQYSAIGADIDAAIARVIRNTAFIMGPEVAQFEEAFAQFCTARYAIGVSSGTSALELVLRALEIGPGDEVITVAHTFIATAEAISATGATPVFVDIDPRTYTMDPAAFAAAITPATRACIPVHLYGLPADMSALVDIAHTHHVPLIEDAAQAHGATWHGQLAGTLADAACFSFYPGKNLGAYGDAGAVVTDNEELARTVRMLRNHGRTAKYVHEIRGYGERIDTLQAAILLAKLPYLPGWVADRRRLAARYDQLLQACELGPNSAEPWLVLPHVPEAAQSAWHLYVICTPFRDELLTHLVERGIGAGIHYPIPLHLQPAYADLPYSAGDLPVTERVAASCLSLPIYPEMSDAQQAYVVSCIGEFLEAKRAEGTEPVPAGAHSAGGYRA